jgi:Spy/CpxP family protein refolding chaperone
MFLFYFFMKPIYLNLRLHTAVLAGFVALAPVVFVTTPLSAQQTLISPYREQLASEIRGLTTKEVEDLREGLGMGLARAAELNGYPGPRHILDAVKAGEFHLNPEQLGAVQHLFEAMSAEARHLGSTILAEEQALEAVFRAGTIDAPNLRERLTKIAALQGELRAVHLRTHLQMRALLTDHQIERYNEVRGYTKSGASPHEDNH